jgi:hypothetical protein
VSLYEALAAAVRGHVANDYSSAASGLSVHRSVRTSGFAPVTTGYAGKDPQQVMDQDFEYGLERALGGLQTRLDVSTCRRQRSAALGDTPCLTHSPWQALDDDAIEAWFATTQPIPDQLRRGAAAACCPATG